MNIYSKILQRFPKGIVYSFAYGSGVKHQRGYDKSQLQKSNVIDLTICVEDVYKWHEENIKLNAKDYSSIRLLGSRFISSYQNNLAANVYFNTLVHLPNDGVTIKYGVISNQYLQEDLIQWNHLYLAGRLHKPVLNLISPTDINLENALIQNLKSALIVALLLLPAKCSYYDLFHTICNISYKGDFRMIFGENKNKVKNIVAAQLEEFEQLYFSVLPTLSQFVGVGLEQLTKAKFIEQDKSEACLRHHLQSLPISLQAQLMKNLRVVGDFREFVDILITNKRLPEMLSKSLDSIVWRSSITQSIKNMPTAGITKSLIYSYRKAVKTFT